MLFFLFGLSLLKRDLVACEFCKRPYRNHRCIKKRETKTKKKAKTDLSILNYHWPLRMLISYLGRENYNFSPITIDRASERDREIFCSISQQFNTTKFYLASRNLCNQTSPSLTFYKHLLVVGLILFFYFLSLYLYVRCSCERFLIILIALLAYTGNSTTLRTSVWVSIEF